MCIKKDKIINYAKVTLLLLTVILYLCLFFNNQVQLANGTLMVALSALVVLYYIDKDIFNPISIYTIFWLAVAGISTFKISNSQQSWSWYMWLIVLLAYISFVIGYFIINRNESNCSSVYNKQYKKIKVDKDKLYLALIVLTSLTLIAFILEVSILKYIPLFSDNMSAYRDFSIKGVHYFVVLVGVIPAITILYKSIGGKKNIILFNIISFSISILIVSRQLIMLQVVLIILAYNYLIKKIKVRSLIATFLVAIILFSFSFSLRNQNNQYVNDVAKVKVEYQNSILVRPLLYFNMNFENLRNTVENFDDYKLGTNMIFPVLAFTNTKGFVDYSYKEDYWINKHFTTSTYLSDIYYDFGIVGVVVIPFVLGMIYALLYNRTKKYIGISSVIYFILLFSLIFCFFVNWYYNTTIVFYIVILLLTDIYVNNDSRKYFENIIKRFKK